MARKKAAPAGAPMWMVTFGDLMSILVCFFVLILSFSIMDLQRFHEIAGSIREAFGTTQESRRKSIVELDGVPFVDNAPTLRNTPIPRVATPLPVHSGASVGDDGNDDPEFVNYPETYAFARPDPSETDTPSAMQTERLRDAVRALQAQADARADAERQARALQERLETALSDLVSTGQIAVEREGDIVKIVLPAEIAFGSGSDELTRQFVGVLDTLAGEVRSTGDDITIAGHTDSLPIATARFHSNWELSTARAVAAVEYLQLVAGIDGGRLIAQGHADTRPIASNETRDGRAANRRVEFFIGGS